MTFQRNFLVSVLASFVLCSAIQISRAMECRLPSGASFCPGFTDFPQDEFCCGEGGSYHCCDSSEYIKAYGLGVLVPVLLVIAVALTATLCLCCLCCPCCLLYKRRHNGTVYGRVQPPATVVTVQQPVPPYPAAGGIPVLQPMGQPIPPTAVPGYPPPGAYPDYATMQGPLHQQQQPPPPYNVATATEGYAKQAPYNPNY